MFIDQLITISTDLISSENFTASLDENYPTLLIRLKTEYIKETEMLILNLTQINSQYISIENQLEALENQVLEGLI